LIAKQRTWQSTVIKVLLIGYGNPGRLDDGMGPSLAGIIEENRIPGVTVDADYQLLVEDAAAVAEHDVVVFADAAVKGAEPFSFTEIEPAPGISFSTHSVDPSEVLALAGSMFGSEARGYALAIRGYEFNEFEERLSLKARRNLAEAAAFIEGVIRNKLFADAASGSDAARAGNDEAR